MTEQFLPRPGPQVVGVRYRCGCVNAVDEASGVLRNVSKCARHVAMLRHQPTGRAYYEMLDCFRDGVPTCIVHIAEMVDAIGPFPDVANEERGLLECLEVGCGASMYAPALLKAGYKYRGIEPNKWAAAWTFGAFDVDVTCGEFATEGNDTGVGLVLCAHALEHMDDAPGALAEMFRILRPGGWLFLLVPDDADPVNPDHKWFFNETSLRSVVDRVGFVNVLLATRKIVERESFIYCKARKPRLAG